MSLLEKRFVNRWCVISSILVLATIAIVRGELNYLELVVLFFVVWALSFIVGLIPLKLICLFVDKGIGEVERGKEKLTAYWFITSIVLGVICGSILAVRSGTKFEWTMIIGFLAFGFIIFLGGIPLLMIVHAIANRRQRGRSPVEGHVESVKQDEKQATGQKKT